jgi:hypothetical protein
MARIPPEQMMITAKNKRDINTLFHLNDTDSNPVRIHLNSFDSESAKQIPYHDPLEGREGSVGGGPVV